MYDIVQHPDQRVAKLLQSNAKLRPTSSILNTRRDPSCTTDRYTETDDLAVIETFNANGWHIVDYNEVKPRSADRQGYQKYCATYENPELNLDTDKGKARLLQIGSHDGRTRLVIDAGFFTFACANGLVCGDSLFEPVAIKHIGEIPLQLDQVMQRFADAVPVVFRSVEQMTKKELSFMQVRDFAKKAAELRFRDAGKVKLEDVVRVQYKDQDSNSVWDVFNRIQANIIEKPYAGFVSTSPETNKQRQVRKVTSIDAKIKLNKDLWHIAQSFVQ